jgi:glyoxylase-like metal-dependent hydrolase (beta-lactamase superfamily II)
MVNLPEDSSLQKLAKNVYSQIWRDDSVFSGYGANQSFVVLEDSVIVFDSGLSLLQARRLDMAIGSVTEKRVKYLVNSHDHSDHVFGNSYFARKYMVNGLSIISHQNCRSQLEALGRDRMKGYRSIKGMKELLSNLDIVTPSVTYKDIGFTLEIEGTEFAFVHPPTGAHTLGDTIMFIPRKGIMLAGDVVWNYFLPNLEDANLEGWIYALSELNLDRYTKCVPGHGDVCGPSEVRKFAEYLREVRRKISDLSSNPESFKDSGKTRSCFETPETAEWKLRMIIDHNVRALFGKTMVAKTLPAIKSRKKAT